MRQGRLQLDLRPRRPTRRPAPFRLLVAGAIALAATSGVRAEPEPVLEASALVGPELLSGPGWQVDPDVPVRGYQARFTVRSRWGVLQADSVELLAVRVAEMPAVERLHRADVGEVVLAAAGERGREPVESLAAIGREPVRTVAGLPGGVARYFSERWDRLRSQARRLGDRARDLALESGSPYDDAGGPIGAAADERPSRKGGWFRKRGRDVAREVEREVALPAARRRLAARLGIDPSTRNPLIRPRLEALAWAEASGRLAAGEALSLLGADAVAVMSHAAQVRRFVLEVDETDARERNRARLGERCLDEYLLRAFVREKAYSTALQTEFVDLVERIDPASGCEALIETALMAGDEAQARFVVNALRLVALAPGAVPGGRFVPQGALLAYEAPDGELVLPLAVDWLSWTPEVARWFALPAIDRRARRTLLVSGGVGPEAARELARRGWSVVERVRHDGAPPYRTPLRWAGPDAVPPAGATPSAPLPR